MLGARSRSNLSRLLRLCLLPLLLTQLLCQLPLLFLIIRLLLLQAEQQLHARPHVCRWVGERVQVGG